MHQPPHDPAAHQRSLIALCHAAQLPVVPVQEIQRHLRIPLWGQHQYLDIIADLTCELDHQLTWRLHAIYLGTLRTLETGRIPCTEPWHHALLIAWVGYRQQGGTQPYQLWRLEPATPWQQGA